MRETHVVMTGPDGIRWVTLEPLMTDIESAIAEIVNIPVDDLKEEDKHIIDMKIAGLKCVYEFLGSIITADNLKKMKESGHETTKH